MGAAPVSALDFDDELCAFLTAWDQKEQDIGRIDVIDFNLPEVKSPHPSASGTRLDYVAQAQEILDRMDGAGLQSSFEYAKLNGQLQTLRALCGEAMPLDGYVNATMGFTPVPYPERVLQALPDELEAGCKAFGLSVSDLFFDEVPEPNIGPDQADIERAFRSELDRLKDVFRAQFGFDLDFNLSIEFVSVDAYWSYWIDGAGKNYRLRFNRSDRLYGQSEVTQFCLHELIGHCGQAAGWHAAIERGALSKFSGLLTVHSCEQVHLEGYAQGLPFLLDETKGTLVELRALKHLLRKMALNNAYLSLNRGEKIETVVRSIEACHPVKDRDALIKDLSDQVLQPVMRTYMFSYPKGIELVHAISKSPEKARRFVTESMHRPLRAGEMESFV